MYEGTIAWAVVLTAGCVMACGENDEAVRLTGSPRAIGTAWGTLNGAVIRRDIQEHFVAPASEKGFSEADLIARAERFVAICLEITPHWLEEADAIARAAEVAPALYRAYIGCVYRSLWAGDECTSYAVHKAHTRDGT
ncbi:MAG TPA: hypothetical protein ENN80_15535, partial [Candidatus Hydrogenedentes bacterium]|nr:hypothetical protein [Candidatus Hydrogenedentota bacterium]